MITQNKKMELVLPMGFPQELIKEIESLINEILIAEALEVLPDDQAKNFYQLIKGRDKLNGSAFEFLEEKKPGFLDQIFKKIEKQIEKIISYKVKIIYG